jgi:type VI secretion system protein ImpE
LFGEPAPWMGVLLQANSLAGQGNYAAAAQLRDQAFDEAPASEGILDGEPFAWIADADSRLGPMLEVILDGKYYWVPFCRIARIVMDKPSDLRDLVWKPATFVWTNGGEAAAHIPTRYPGSEASTDDAIRMARKTDWTEQAGGYAIGLGQRLLATDAGEKSILECLKIELKAPAQAG